MEMAEAVSVFRLGDARPAAIAAAPQPAPLARVPSPTVARLAKPLPGAKLARAAATTTVEEWKEF
jgi:hypothetical protein